MNSRRNNNINNDNNTNNNNNNSKDNNQNSMTRYSGGKSELRYSVSMTGITMNGMASRLVSTPAESVWSMVPCYVSISTVFSMVLRFGTC